MMDSIAEVYKLMFENNYSIYQTKLLIEHIKYLKYMDALQYGAITPKEFRLIVLEEKHSKLLKAITSETPTIRSIVDQLLVAIELDNT